MSEQPRVWNELSGSVWGPVVQAGVVHGDVNLSPGVHSSTSEEAELRARLMARGRAILDAEDAARAAAAQRRMKSLRRTRIRFRICWVQTVFFTVAVVLIALMNWGVIYEFLGILYGAIALAGIFYNGAILRRSRR